MSAAMVGPWAEIVPDLASRRAMVGFDTPDLCANSACSHRNSARAARRCSLVRFTQCPHPIFLSVFDTRDIHDIYSPI
jgi:hypothetical protein